MTNREKINKLINLKFEISRLRAEQYRYSKNHNKDLVIGAVCGVSTLAVLNLILKDPSEIAHYFTTGALAVSSLLSLINYKDYDVIMSYYNQEVDYLKEEVSRTI